MKQNLLKTFKLRVLMLVALLCAGFTSAWGDATYTKVETAPSDWSGTYVIVADASNVIFTGQSGTNTYGGYATVTINDKSVSGNFAAYEVLVEKSENYYTIKHVNSSKYLGWTSGNALAFSTTAPTANSYKWVLSTSSILNANDNSRKLQYNSGSPRFACYTSSQKVAYLYKKESGSQTENVATPTFNPAAGAYTSAQNVTISTTTSGATIYYTTDGTDPTTSSSVYSSAIPVSTTTTIKAMAVKSGMDNSAVASATYTITLPLTTIDEIFAAATEAGNTATPKVVTFNNWVVTGVKNSNAYVTDGTKGFIIYANGHGFAVGDVLSGTASCKVQLYKGAAEITELTTSTSGLSVTTGGTITPVTTISIADLSGVNTGAVVSYENLAYDGTNLSDGTNTIKPFNSLYDYSMTNGKSYNVTGVYVQYEDTKEILPRSAEDVVEMVSTDPVINANATLSLAYNATSGEIAYTIDHPVTGTALNATSTAEWISNINVGSESIIFTTTENEGAEDRTATITLTYTGADAVTITVTQGHFVLDYATLPFAWEGGVSADLIALAGVTASGLGSDYAEGNAPYRIKYDSTDDYIQVKTNERPGIVSIGVKMIGGASTSTITVQESSDGEYFTNVQELTISGAQNSVVNLETTATFAETSRYVRLNFTKGSNVGVGPITITQYAVSQEYTLTVSDLSHVDLFVFGGDESETIIEGEGTAQVSNGTNVVISVDVEAGYELESLVVDGNDVTSQIDSQTGMYVFIMPNHNVTITATAVEETVTPVTGDKYVKVTSTADLTSGQYLIVYEDGSVAFNGGLETLDAVSNTIAVSISNSEIPADATTNAAAFTIDVAAGTIKSASDLYIGVSSNTNGLKQSDEASTYTNTFSIDNDENAVISAVFEESTMALRYNKTSGQTRFRYFKNAGQEAIQLYKFVEGETPTPEPVTVTISEAGYSTLYYGDRNLVVPTDMEAYTVKVTTQVERSKTYNAGDVIPAGTGVVLKAASSQYTFIATSESGEADNNNMLRGSDEKAWTTGGTYYYALTLNANRDIDSAGFYWMNETGGAYQAGAHKAYLALDQTFAELAGGNTVKGFLALPGNSIVTGIANMNRNVNENAIFNLAGQRVNKATKGLYIMNGKKVIVK